tara:strand:+ start:1653 stop:2315 length:663 start_codon:yes stop_codon:yes gene_type:complete
VEEIQLYAFDLDGTLLDTAPDFFYAVNKLREANGLESGDFSEVRSRVSQGAASLARYSLNWDVNQKQEIEKSRLELLEIYEKCCLGAELFDGMSEVLINLNEKNKNWGIVTNKPRKYAEQIVNKKLSSINPHFLICPDDVGERKPSPKGLKLACELTNVSSKNSIYVGDHQIDITSGKSANMRTIAAAYGYIPEGDAVSNWDADFIINHPLEMNKIIENH